MNYKKTLGNKYLCLLIVKCDQYNFKYSYSKKSQEGGTGVCVLSIWSKNVFFVCKRQGEEMGAQ